MPKQADASKCLPCKVPAVKSARREKCPPCTCRRGDATRGCPQRRGGRRAARSRRLSRPREPARSAASARPRSQCPIRPPRSRRPPRAAGGPRPVRRRVSHRRTYRGVPAAVSQPRRMTLEKCPPSVLIPLVRRAEQDVAAHGVVEHPRLLRHVPAILGRWYLVEKRPPSSADLAEILCAPRSRRYNQESARRHQSTSPRSYVHRDLEAHASFF